MKVGLEARIWWWTTPWLGMWSNKENHFLKERKKDDSNVDVGVIYYFLHLQVGLNPHVILKWASQIIKATPRTIASFHRWTPRMGMGTSMDKLANTCRPTWVTSMEIILFHKLPIFLDFILEKHISTRDFLGKCCFVSFSKYLFEIKTIN